MKSKEIVKFRCVRCGAVIEQRRAQDDSDLLPICGDCCDWMERVW